MWKGRRVRFKSNISNSQWQFNLSASSAVLSLKKLGYLPDKPITIYTHNFSEDAQKLSYCNGEHYSRWLKYLHRCTLCTVQWSAPKINHADSSELRFLVVCFMTCPACSRHIWHALNTGQAAIVAGIFVYFLFHGNVELCADNISKPSRAGYSPPMMGVINARSGVSPFPSTGRRWK